MPGKELLPETNFQSTPARRGRRICRVYEQRQRDFQSTPARGGRLLILVKYIKTSLYVVVALNLLLLIFLNWKNK